MSSLRNEPIAVIGLGCRFPGGCNTASKLWELLQDPQDLCQDIPPERFNIDRFYHKTGSHHGTTNVRRSYLLDEDVTLFDHKFFGVPPAEAEAIDPQQRLLLEVTYDAIESAGCTLNGLHGSDTAVYVGLMTSDYLMQQSQDTDFLPKYNATGVANSNASSRLSYFFNWHGPSMTIDTACSSSLVAVSEAVQALRTGVSKVAVAAGTNLLLYPFSYISESKLNMLSPTGRSRMWDVDADGYARGEGVAAVVLKTLSAAIQDGDRIECVIREIGLNHDGKTTGLTMPSAVSQANLIQKVYRQAGLNPLDRYDRCHFFEAHGTGTPAGDPQEAEALSRAFFNSGNGDRAEDDFLLVGSIKTVVGHTEGTAGLAGLLKACLALKHGVIPPNLLFNRLNPRLESFTSHLKIPTTAQPWPVLPHGVPRRASVNSFGFGGANAHAILEAFPVPSELLNGISLPLSFASTGETLVPRKISDAEDKQRCAQHTPSPLVIPFVFSAATTTSLLLTLRAIQTYLDTNLDIDPSGLASILVHKRSALPVRIAISTTTIEELRLKIADTLSRNENKDDRNFGGHAPGKPAILGVFNGQGAQWAAMGTKLLSSIPMARRIIHELDESLSALPEATRPRWSLTRELLATASSRIDQAEISQPLCTAVQLVLIDLLRAAGVRFAAVVGHSSGEIAAAYAAGFLSKFDAIRISYYRGYFAKLASGGSGVKGGMLAAGTSFDDAQKMCELEDLAGQLHVAANNSPQSVTLSGDIAAIELAKCILEEEKKFARRLRVDTAYHSHHMEPCAIPYLTAMQECDILLLTPSKDAPKWFSSVYDGALINRHSELSGQYWVDNMTKPVLFFNAVQECSKRFDGKFTFALEVGPHPALKSPVLESWKHVNAVGLPYSGTLSRGKHDLEAFKEALGSLWMYAGTGAVNLESFEEECSSENSKQTKTVPELPPYPWDHDRQFLAEPRSYKYHRSHNVPYHSLLGRVMSDSTADHWRWKNVLNIHELDWMEGHALHGQPVFPATGYVALAMEAAMQIAGLRTVTLIELHSLEIEKAITLSKTSGTEISVHMSDISSPEPDLDGQAELIAELTIYSALASSGSTSMSLNCCGSIRLVFGDEGNADTLPSRDGQPVNVSTVDVTRFYSSLRDDAGYTYDALFKSIMGLSRRFGFATGTIKTPVYENDTIPLLFHPAVADCALQGIFATFSAPGDGSINSVRVPKRCDRISLVPSLCGSNMTDMVNFDCTLRNTLDDVMMSGDIDIYSTDYSAKIMQFEGLAFVPLAPPTIQDDKCVYQEPIWCVDRPDGKLIIGDRKPSPAEQQKALDAERAAFFYLNRLHSSVDQATRTVLPWYRQALLDSAQQMVEKARQGQHDYANTWVNDTRDQIEEMMDSYDNDADFNLTRAVGEHLTLPAVLSGDVNILEYMTQNDYLGRYYREAAGFESLNTSVAGLVAQLSNKFPSMHFCEIGAGTGGATQSVFDAIGNAFASYTYTDISSGFLDTAQDKFRQHSGKMVFKTLNIEHDPVDQGFPAHGYDCVLAANVLHATKFLDVTMQNVRRLLKPGGYLILFEIIGNNVMRIGTVMGGLPGWWIGHDDGRKWAPTIELEEWDAVLKRNGFSGVDTHTPMVDIVSLPGSIFCSMACDERISALREPLSRIETTTPSETLVLIRGKSAACDDLLPVLTHYFQKLIVVEELDVLPEIPANTHVLCLEDCGGSVFEGMTEKRWANLKRLLESPKSVLWVSAGAHESNPYAGMSVGLFRNLYYEMPGSLLQLLDCQDDQRVDVHTIAELQIRLKQLADMQNQGTLTNVLWTIEPELRLRDGRLEVLRVRPQDQQNSRLNSMRRKITRFADPRTSTLELVSSKDSYQIRERHDLVAHVADDHEVVQVSMSFLVPVKTPAGHAFVHLGISEQTGKKILCLSPCNSSRVLLHSSWVVPVEFDVIDRQYMSLIVGDLVNQQVMKMIPSTGALLAHDCDPGLASLLSKQLTAQGRTVVFTSEKPETKMRGGKWAWLHPQCTSRAIRAIMPPALSVYLDASSIVGTSSSIASQIEASIPASCQRIRITDILGTTSSQLQHKAPESVLAFLQHAVSFASAQLNGVPEGAPIEVMLPRQIALATPAMINTPILVDWLADRQVPILEQPISSWPGLFRSDRTYWLAGLTGDLGRSMTDFMIAHGARYVALSSRSPVVNDPWVQWHRSNDVFISYFTGDVMDFPSVERMRNQIISTMPEVGGVALGALVLCDRMFAQMTLEEFQRVARPKVDGAINFDRLFADSDPPLDFFVGLSSVVATIGNPGQANYAAANCFMKAIVNRRRGRGLSGSIIDISRVVGVGYVEREMKADGRLTREQKERLFTGSMTLAMSESDIHQLFAEAIIAGAAGSNANPEIITGLAPVRRDKVQPNSWPSNPKFELLIRVGDDSVIESSVASGQVSARELLREAQSANHRSKILNECFKSKLRTVLFLSTVDIISDTLPLIDIGVDSLVSVELRAWCLKELAVDIPVIKILGGLSLNDMVSEILIGLTSF